MSTASRDLEAGRGGLSGAETRALAGHVPARERARAHTHTHTCREREERQEREKEREREREKETLTNTHSFVCVSEPVADAIQLAIKARDVGSIFRAVDSILQHSAAAVAQDTAVRAVAGGYFLILQVCLGRGGLGWNQTGEGVWQMSAVSAASRTCI